MTRSRSLAVRPNQGLQRTALGADKIAAILKSGIGPIAFPIYECAAADAQGVRRQPSMPVTIERPRGGTITAATNLSAMGVENGQAEG